MKFKLIAVLGAVAVVVSFTMPSFAASKSSAKSRAHATQSSVVQAANASTCTGSCTLCPRMNGATKTSATVRPANASGACDPSQCPASCQRENAGAVAANVKSR